MARGPKKQRLNIFLMKEGVGITECFRDDLSAGILINTIHPNMGFDGQIASKGTPANAPRWQRFVQSGSPQALGVLLNQSASCVIILQITGRVFAITFGFGRHWIDESLIVRRFGMIVTLNVVHPDRIKSVDREEFDTIQRKTRSQTSISSNLDSFGLNVQRDLVRSVTGQPEDMSFASHVTGADNLILNLPITFEQLGQKCAEALDHYKSEAYRERYPWIDNFTRVNDPGKIDILDQALVDELRSGATDSAFLTPPDTLDTQEHRGFRYPGERSSADLRADLRTEEYFETTDRASITVEELKKRKIREYSGSDDTPSRQFRIYDALIYEVTRDLNLYVLSFGEWFEIAQDHVAAVSAQLATIKSHEELILTDAQAGESEGAYNSRIANASDGYLALLDARPVVYGGGRSSVEICDLLTADRCFIHVKAKTKSSTLSHLFAQGLNSAQAFRDARFRELAFAKCPESHREIFFGEPRASDHTITYAIITQAPGDLRNALPFFSKQSLVNAALTLTNMGYQVRLKKIGIG